MPAVDEVARRRLVLLCEGVAKAAARQVGAHRRVDGLAQPADAQPRRRDAALEGHAVVGHDDVDLRGAARPDGERHHPPVLEAEVLAEPLADEDGARAALRARHVFRRRAGGPQLVVGEDHHDAHGELVERRRPPAQRPRRVADAAAEEAAEEEVDEEDEEHDDQVGDVQRDDDELEQEEDGEARCAILALCGLLDQRRRARLLRLRVRRPTAVRAAREAGHWHAVDGPRERDNEVAMSKRRRRTSRDEL